MPSKNKIPQDGGKRKRRRPKRKFLRSGDTKQQLLQLLERYAAQRNPTSNTVVATGGRESGGSTKNSSIYVNAGGSGGPGFSLPNQQPIGGSASLGNTFGYDRLYKELDRMNQVRKEEAEEQAKKLRSEIEAVRANQGPPPPPPQSMYRGPQPMDLVPPQPVTPQDLQYVEQRINQNIQNAISSINPPSRNNFREPPPPPPPAVTLALADVHRNGENIQRVSRDLAVLGTMARTIQGELAEATSANASAVQALRNEIDTLKRNATSFPEQRAEIITEMKTSTQEIMRGIGQSNNVRITAVEEALVNYREKMKEVLMVQANYVKKSRKDMKAETERLSAQSAALEKRVKELEDESKRVATQQQELSRGLEQMKDDPEGGGEADAIGQRLAELEQVRIQRQNEILTLQQTLQQNGQQMKAIQINNQQVSAMEQSLNSAMKTAQDMLETLKSETQRAERVTADAVAKAESVSQIVEEGLSNINNLSDARASSLERMTDTLVDNVEDAIVEVAASASGDLSAKIEAQQQNLATIQNAVGTLAQEATAITASLISSTTNNPQDLTALPQVDPAPPGGQTVKFVQPPLPDSNPVIPGRPPVAPVDQALANIDSEGMELSKPRLPPQKQGPSSLGSLQPGRHAETFRSKRAAHHEELLKQKTAAAINSQPAAPPNTPVKAPPAMSPPSATSSPVKPKPPKAYVPNVSYGPVAPTSRSSTTTKAPYDVEAAQKSAAQQTNLVLETLGIENPDDQNNIYRQMLTHELNAARSQATGSIAGGVYNNVGPEEKRVTVSTGLAPIADVSSSLVTNPNGVPDTFENIVSAGLTEEDKSNLADIQALQEQASAEGVMDNANKVAAMNAQRREAELAEGVKPFTANGRRGRGGRRIPKEGLSDDDIDTLAIAGTKALRNSYKGVYARDEIENLVLPKDKPSGIVINTDPSSKAGEHWVAAWVDPRSSESTLEYYDSLGDDPDKPMEKSLLKMVEKNFGDRERMMKFKTNAVQAQRANSANCGFFALKFITDRAGGKSFAKATGYNELKQAARGEKDLRKFKKKFGYI